MKARLPGGFGLIELMTVLAIVVLLALLGLSSYHGWIVNTQVRNAAEAIQNGLKLARSESVARNAPIRFQLTAADGGADWQVCPAAAAATTCGADVLQDFVAAAGARAAQVGATSDTALATDFKTRLTSGTPAGVTFDGLGRPLNYGTRGSAGSARRFDVGATESGTRWLVVTVSAGGQVRMCDPQLDAGVSPQACR